MDKLISEAGKWEHSPIEVFWGEIAPCDHVVQIYENDYILLDTLQNFVTDGFVAGDSVIIIATRTHLKELEERLKAVFDLNSFKKQNRYIPVDAETALSGFLINNWPDEKLFTDFVHGLVAKARTQKSKVRAFGEMVAVLWEKGLNGATVRLENLWQQLHDKNNFTLYCAYPKSGFTQSPGDSIEKICACHSKIIDGQTRPRTEIYYKDL